ncbi:adenosylmethionine--8-amino-7-oxononanoate transaminase [Allorhodopirellula heiligendammensis]|uniref:Adenosylmethionine-8-amino-7-oxononanoate aminotransferase n=1 Tax=Allorhodopirellula heiligendammensis TaxID=2714739 RepID=A0A5C6BF18_9BACT|nr:adenosylmethionine--8-amino-7-oxononanoate transaminase [Allorhodopirellula heiligendammensis]TWU10775.1 Adenosylmethionine-8-amino-7-oxononanoate aminotransferase [Allorhodopirellula heiligendammensis]
MSNQQQRSIWRPYCQMKTAPPPLEIVSAHDFELTTADGRSLIDGMASWWSVCHGYNHPHVVESVSQQLAKMPHVMFGGITHEPAERLAARLAALLPADLNHVFFADSGSVAVEVAMKMAVGYWRRRGQANRQRFLSFTHAYHGDTTGAMSLCDPQRSMHADYGKAILSQFHCPLPVDEITEDACHQLLSVHQGEVAGIFIEPLVQGAGGMRFHSASTVSRIRRLCDEHEVLMIADEIATGFGRTGTMFAIDACDVVPDIICLGKALTAGTMTMAVSVACGRVFDAFWSDRTGDALMHGPTFMANPLACAAANASLDLFESEPRVEQAHSMELKLRMGLSPARSLPGVVDVRCRGAIGVIQVESLHDVEELRQNLVDAGVWLRPFGDCVYVTPPLNLPDPLVEQLCNTIVDVMGKRQPIRLS